MTMPKTSDPSPSVAPLKPHQPQAQPTSAMLKQRSSSPFLAGPSTSAGPTLSAIAGGASSLLLKLGVQQRHSLSPARYPPGLQQQQQQHYPQQDHPKAVSCAACGSTVPVSFKCIKRHPKLNIVVCESCHRFYFSGKWERDADGHFIHCQCCADGGNMVCCSRCDQVACRSCLKRILGRKELAAALDKEWQCLVCHPYQMSTFLSASLRALRSLQVALLHGGCGGIFAHALRRRQAVLHHQCLP